MPCSKSGGQIPHLEKRLHYATPLFERAALATQGILNVEDWRYGDALVIDVEETAPTLVADAPVDLEWDRFVIGSQIVALRRASYDAGQLALTSPYPDGSFVQQSVSARDGYRGSISLWTSRGKVAAAGKYEQLSSFLAELEAGSTATRAIALAAANDHDRRVLRAVGALLEL